MAEVDYLTHSGLLSLFERLWEAAVVLPGNDPLLAGLVDRMLVTGLTPNGTFEPARRANPKVAELNFYVCSLTQPLDDHWSDSPGCLQDEGDWTGYRIAWGILATDEATATQLAIELQARCGSTAATVDEVEIRGEKYHDHPGVVWQGVRAPTTP